MVFLQESVDVVEACGCGALLAEEAAALGVKLTQVNPRIIPEGMSRP